MKKLLCCLLAFCTVGALAGCDDGDSKTECELSYNTKYIRLSEISGVEENKMDYYIFYKDGTADYYYGSTSDNKLSAYTMHFRYALVEEQEMVFCFYNGHTYAEDDEYKASINVKENEQLMYTKDFIMTTGGTMYVTQAFIDTVPNFGKRETE